MSPPDPFWVYRVYVKEPWRYMQDGGPGPYKIQVDPEDLRILLYEHDTLATMDAYDTDCRECAERLDGDIEMMQYEDEMLEWGWQ